jgi:hypothetical protein
MLLKEKWYRDKLAKKRADVLHVFGRQAHCEGEPKSAVQPSRSSAMPIRLIQS